MTMLDDDRLAALLTEAAATFEVPAAGPQDILARVDDGPTGNDDRDAPAVDDVVPQGRVRRLAGLAGLAGRHRVVSVAAAFVAVLVVTGAVAALTRGPAQPSRTSALSRPTGGAPAHAPATTTTTPQRSTNGSGLQSKSFAANGDRAGNASGNSAQGTGAGPTNATTPTTAPPLPSGAVGQPAKIEQTGSLALTVARGKLSRTVTQLTALAGAYGGFVANSQTQTATADGGASGSVTLQIPVQSFATVLTRAKALGTTSDLTTKATDVTGQYVDLQARITALQASRQQYLAILAKATTVGDVLSVQEQINALQVQIEQLQGQLQLLTSQTTYSTLTVTVNEHTPAPAPSPRTLPESGLVRAWHASIGGFVTGVEGLIRVAGPLLFVLLLLGVVLVGGRALWRRYQRHNL